MRKPIIFAIVIWIVAIVVLSGILILGLTGGSDMFSIFGFGTSWGTRLDGIIPPNGKASISTFDIKTLRIDWVGGTVTVERYNGSEILLEQSSHSEIPEDRMMVYLVENGILRIREGSGLRIRSRPATSLTVLIPENFSFIELRIEGISSDLKVSNLTISTGKISTVSGDANLSSLSYSGDLNVETVSGNISIDSLIGVEKLNLETVSGDIYGSGVVCKELKSNSVSGKVQLGGEFGSIKSNTVSGDNQFTSTTLPSSIKMDTVSGDLTITLPENDGFVASYSKVSGNFNCAFPTISEKGSVTYKDGGTKISLSTVSGDLRINKLD